MNSPRTKTLYWVLALALAAPLLYFSLRGIQWGRVLETLAGARPGYMAASFVLVTTTLLLRSIRWRVLLLAEGPVTIPAAFWATSAGYFGNNFLPARAGELVRTMMVSSRAGLSRTYVLTTALSERIVDAIVLVVISAITIAALPSRLSWMEDARTPFALIGILGIVAIIVLPFTEKLFTRWVSVLPLPVRFADKLQAVVAHVLRAIRSFHDARRLTAFLLLTGMIWFLDAITATTVAHGLGLPMNLRVAFLLIAALGLGSALPSTPGYVGVYQFLAVAVLTPFGYARDEAIAFILMFQALQYAVYGVWGVLALWFSRQEQSVMRGTASPAGAPRTAA